jgi:hypothetical protein
MPFALKGMIVPFPFSILFGRYLHGTGGFSPEPVAARVFLILILLCGGAEASDSGFYWLDCETVPLTELDVFFR